jgi:putative FmdB family regulatory protein
MPIFEYQCKDCGATYDVFHKVREVEEDIVCPSCTSKEHQRLLSAPNFSMSTKAGSDFCSSSPGCGCGGGACELN